MNAITTKLRWSMRRLLIAVAFLGSGLVGQGQAVTEIITDFNGFWKSGAAAINAVRPNNSHNLLAFTFNGVRFSTGANDNLLSTQGLFYMNCDFRALPVYALSGQANSLTKIGLGSSFDGVENGRSTIPPAANIPLYVTDGIKGLDIGTGVANLPAGNVEFGITDINLNSIGDGFPDILITQIADPSGSSDRYEFIDVNGNRVGNHVNILLNNIAPIGHWSADFYEASQVPMGLALGFTKTERPLRLWASDFSDFGINPSNFSRIAGFRITVSGNSDVAFVAYNFNTLQFSLPVTVNHFSADVEKDDVFLSWTLSDLDLLQSTIIERSMDGLNFEPVHAIINNVERPQFSFVDVNRIEKTSYYRLRFISKDGSVTFSRILKLNIDNPYENHLQVWPNPASDIITVEHNLSDVKTQISVRDVSGQVQIRVSVLPGKNKTLVPVAALRAGMYYVSVQRENSIETRVMKIVR